MLRLAPSLESGRWLEGATIRHHRKGERIVRAGAALREWIALAAGCVRVDAIVAAEAKVAVATLWSGDVIGRRSPIGSTVALYDVVAQVETTTITLAVPAPHAAAAHDDERHDEMEQLQLASASRLHRQIALRLAGNGMQNLVRVLATLAQALTPAAAGGRDTNERIALPLSQAAVGELSGISRRQAWIYLGQLAEAGWVETSRTRITLLGASAWLELLTTLESRGFDAIASIERSIAMLGEIAMPQRSVA